MLPPRLESSASMERVIILAILLALLVSHFLVSYKLAFLGFYYLPVLLAGYFCGKRTALLVSILAIFLIALYAAIEPGKMCPAIGEQQAHLENAPAGSLEKKEAADSIARAKFRLHFSLAGWAAFLVLSAIVSSVLYDQKHRRVEQLRHAYVGLVEILSKYLELADRSSAGRSRKVARLATATAKRLNLSEESIENIRIAALLHDLGHKEVSALILEKSADLGREANATILTHNVSGDEVLRSVTAVLEDVTPIVDAYHKYFAGERKEAASTVVRTGAEIIAMARAYCDLIAGSPTRKAKAPPEAIAEIRSGEGRQFDADVVEGFEKALQDVEEEGEGERSV